MPSNYRGGPKRNDGKIAEKVRAFFINFYVIVLVICE